MKKIDTLIGFIMYVTGLALAWLEYGWRLALILFLVIGSVLLSVRAEKK